MASSRRSPASAAFESKVEFDGPKFVWNADSIDSKGWSGSVLLISSAEEVYIQVVRRPTEWSNEIHVLWPGNWRKTQVAGFLDDGNVYSTYGTRVGKAKKKWQEPGDIAGVQLRRDIAKNTAHVTFIVGEKAVFELDVANPENRPVSDLRLEVRVHPNGAVRIV